MAPTKLTKLYTVITFNPNFRRPEVEAVFSSNEKAEQYINQFFAHAEHTARSIVETYLDPFEEEIRHNSYYYFIAAYPQGSCYQIEVDKTSDQIFTDHVDRLRIDGLTASETPEFSFYCFAQSAEEAYHKFRPQLINYFKEKNINIELAEPRYNQQTGYY